ncbi:MAG: hypothetical protein GX895_12580 [Clostridiales bacterium]|uniref:hypothetical protein n=1 Tax=Clostridium sp. N3C TaxID=1776758 RepID=UPI00092E1225|nr:hypothetical protein [Clostridium sp. N3C]NLZ49585.1 hypothetical protein [Clostridiales bacterium]SCN22826.1 ABC-2 family transporter protein [Clostridium sp. N3C]
MFWNFLKIEVKKIICRMQTLIAFILFIGAYIHISTLDKMDIPNHDAYPKILILEGSNPFISYLKALAGSINSYMPLILPLIILLIVADSLFTDYRTGFFQLNLSRISYKKYIKYKVLSVSVISFLVTFVFQIIAFIYSLATSPYHLPTKAVEDIMAPELERGLYINHPYLYIFLVALIIGLVAMVVSMMGIISSNIFKSTFSVLGGPWIAYLIIGEGLIVIASEISMLLYDFSPLNMIGPIIFDGGYSFIQVFAYWIILFLLLSFIAYKLSVKRFLSGYEVKQKVAV